MGGKLLNGYNDEQRFRVFTPLLTDLYQVTMAYAYWKSDSKDKIAVFDLYFRKNPFGGEYTIFSGLTDCLKLIQNFHFEDDDLAYLRKTLPPYIDEQFYAYLRSLNADSVTLSAIPEGTVVFPRIPLISIEGPLPVVQLLETSLLTFVNYASLVTTNAARYRKAAGRSKKLLEFGLRRAQGPDGGLSASKYCYIGGFDATSNLLAGKLFGIPVDGTHSHAFVSSYVHPQDLKELTIVNCKTNEVSQDFLKRCQTWLGKVCAALFPTMFDIESNTSLTNPGELTAFVAYAFSFPDHFLALVDTYDVMKSGIPNFCAVSLALHEIGYQAVGIRIDSGDLSYLSSQARIAFERVANTFRVPWFANVKIVASNDLNEQTLYALNEQGNEIDCYGVGTHLVTCQRQPALGCVYKLVEISGQPRMKLSQDVEKMSMPGKKNIYRFYGKDGKAILDLIQLSNENQIIEPGNKVLCRHPFQATLRTYVNPTKVESLLRVYWKNGKLTEPLSTLEQIRTRVQESLATLRSDHKRHLNPTPYKVSVTDTMYSYIHKLWEENAPISELS